MKRLLVIFLALCLSGCEDKKFSADWTNEKAPERFLARFETTKGDFEIEVSRKWSPAAADRFYQLVGHHYYDNAIFYRVVPDFVAQFGNTDTPVMNKWRSVKIPDEQVAVSNLRGTVTFARFGKESRDLEVFVNLRDNVVLDTIDFEGVRGFPPFGKIVSGMETVDKLFAGYGEQSMSDPNLYADRKTFYRTFPKLDLIQKAYLVE